MAKVTLQPGILFNVASDLPPTNIPRNEVNEAVHAEKITGNKISLSFTLEIDNARILEVAEEFEENQLRKKGYLPFKPGTTDIDINQFEQSQDQVSENEPAIFTVTGYVPGGKIGGAGFKLANLEKEKESYS